MKRGVLLVRADATVATGTGHVMRCLALAQAWQRAGGDVVFAMAQSTDAIEERLRSEPVEIVAIHGTPGGGGDLQQTLDYARLHKAEWVAVDGYHFNADYVTGLQNALPVLVIDDNGELESYSSSLVLNQNAHANAEMYAKRMPGTRLLLGPSYALLRKEFTAYRKWSRNVPERGTRILLTMGGSDPKDLTPRILSALAGLPIDDLEIRVVVGGSAENRTGVAAMAARFPGRVEVISNVTNMAELMAWADLALAGAGTTCWEMCLLGLPAIVVVVAENQRFIAGHLAGLGAVVNAGPAELIDCPALAQMAADLLDDRDRSTRDVTSGETIGGWEWKRASPGDDVAERCAMRLICLVNNYLGWQSLEYLREQAQIAAVVVHPPERIKFEAEILASARSAGAEVIPANDLRTRDGLAKIAQLKAEMGVSVMFGYVLKPDFLSLLPKGCINLHPAYLPYNRGARPNVWSIVDQTPAGVTLHYIDESIDTGDIIRQMKVPVLITDTGETLYRKLETAGLELLRESWPDIQAGRIERTAQSRSSGTSHKAGDTARIDEIQLAETYRAEDLLNILRARTFPPHQGAFIRSGGRKVHIRIQLEEESDGTDGE